jgi:alkylation response protein AidB-like acyl-CoA dehydrogenase
MSDAIDLKSLVQELGPRIAEGAAERDEAGSFVSENYAILKEHKVFSALVPSEFGGGGARHSEMCAFVRGLAHYCPSTALSVSMHQHLVAAAVVNYRNGRPGQKLLERVAGDESVLVSTTAKDWLESSGNAEKVDGGFRVSARKPFASGAPGGDVMVTSAPYEDPKEGWQILHFAAPFTADEVSIGNDWDTLGMRATGSHTVIRRPRGEYHMAFNTVLTVALPLIMSVYAGLAESAAEIACSQAVKNEGDPAAPFFLGELTNLLTTTQLAVDDMVRIANDYDFEPAIETADAILVRKTIAAKSMLATVEKALEISRGAGFYRRFKLERLLRDAHAAQFHPMQEKPQHHFTGRLALGLDPIENATVRKSRAQAA